MHALAIHMRTLDVRHVRALPLLMGDFSALLLTINVPPPRGIQVINSKHSLLDFRILKRYRGPSAQTSSDRATNLLDYSLRISMLSPQA